MHVIDLDAELLHLDLGVVFVGRPQSPCQKGLQFPLEDPLAVLGDPHQVELVVVGAMRTEPDLHARTISQNPAGCAGPASGWGGFHPRAHARGPQPQAG